MPEELALARVLAHSVEAITSATIHRAHHGAPLVQAGRTEHFVVEYQAHLGSDGDRLARGVLDMCETDFHKIQGWFGGLVPQGLPIRCVIVRGNFGARSMGRVPIPTCRSRRSTNTNRNLLRRPS
jgi:hypothetical protein